MIISQCGLMCRFYWSLTYSLQGTVGLLHAQSSQRPEEVKGKGLGLFPATYHQTHLDLPQYHSLPDEAVDLRPVPWHRYKTVGLQPDEIHERTQTLITGVTAKHQRKCCVLLSKGAAQCLLRASTSAGERQVVDNGDVYEMLRFLYDSGNGIKIVAAMFGDESIWGGLSPEEETQNYSE